ncbi:DUF6556 family protein [Streptococcus suis]|uniref:DUF6556 family protein n=1 Tax=Streptococcus suis TaxID=1307 RepID=UPI002ED5BE68
MKSINRKEHGSALTKLQKFLTFIGSILGIVTACITIYTFSITSNATTTSPSSSVTTVSSINQIGENKSVTIPITEITSSNGIYSSSTTEKSSSLASQKLHLVKKSKRVQQKRRVVLRTLLKHPQVPPKNNQISIAQLLLV